MDYITSSRLQSHSVDEPSPEMPVLHTPAQFALGRGRVSRIPTPPASAHNSVGEHLTALRKRRVSGHLSGAESAPDTDIEFRQGTGRQDLGFIPIPAGGRRRMAASFSGLGNYRPAADLVINGARTWDMKCPVEVDVKPVEMSTPFQPSHVVDVHDRISCVCDSSSSDDDQPSGKHLLAATTPFKTPCNIKKHSTVHHNKNVLPNCHEALEIEQLRGQFNQCGQIVQSLSNRLDDFIDSVVENTPQHTTVKQPENEPTDRLVAQMKALIDGSRKNKKSRKVKLPAVIEQSSASETDTESVSKRHLIRPMKFDGYTSFETFMAHFRNCADHNRWTETEQLSWLKNSLIKNAGQVLWDSSPDSSNTLPKLIELLTNRFGGTKQTDKHRMELRYRKRKPNESLGDLHQYISRLMALAHPQLPSSSRDAIACDYYIDSLNDPEFALKVRERNPSSLDEALRISLQLESWILDTNRQKGDDHGKGKTRENRAATVDSNSSAEIASLQAQLSTLGKTVSDFVNSVKTQPVNNFQQVPFSPQSSVNTGKPQFHGPTKPMQWQNHNTGNSGVRPKACFNCGDPSHFKPNCPLLQTGASNAYQPPVNSQNQPPRGCFLCGDMSHFKRNCPSAPTNSSTTTQGNVQQNRILTGNKYVDDSRVYVKATVEGNSVDCLLDSGCQQTMMPLDLIKRCGYFIRPTNKVVRANGTVME